MKETIPRQNWSCFAEWKHITKTNTFSLKIGFNKITCDVTGLDQRLGSGQPSSRGTTPTPSPHRESLGHSSGHSTRGGQWAAVSHTRLRTTAWRPGTASQGFSLLPTQGDNYRELWWHLCSTNWDLFHKDKGTDKAGLRPGYRPGYWE